MKRLKPILIFLIALAIVFAGLRFGNRRVEKSNPEVSGISLPVFQVVSYNSHLLPPVANSIAGERGNADYRCIKIAEQLSKFDISGVSEVFDEKLAAKMIDEMNAHPKRTFNFVRSPSPKGVFQFASGGLILFSRFPILDDHFLEFSTGSRFLSSGFKAADGLAAKGALHARLLLDKTNELDCFLVHLESSSTTIRKKQLEELAAFLRSNCRVGVPYLLMGDFNISGPLNSDTSGHKTYNDMIAQMSMNDFIIIDVAISASEGLSARGTSDALTDDGGDRIDYLLLGVPAANSDLRATSCKTIRYLDDGVKEGSLSDHAAVWARFQLGQ